MMATVAFPFGCIILIHSLGQKDLLLYNRMFFGFDYSDLYGASQVYLRGFDIYANRRVVVPPAFPALFSWLTWFREATAAWIMAGITLASVVGGLGLVARAMGARIGRAALLVFVLTVILLPMNYPFLFLFDRENLDGIVLLFCLAAMFGVGRGGRWDYLAGACLALAAGIKVYPVLLVVPLIISRRWKVLGAMAAAMIILIGATSPGLWGNYVMHRMIGRTEWFTLYENGSIANTIAWTLLVVQDIIHTPLWPDPGRFLLNAYGVVFLMLFLPCVVLDAVAAWKGLGEDAVVRVLRYFPFMVAIPKIAFHYEFIVLLALLPVLVWDWQQAKDPHDRTRVLWQAVALGFSQFPAMAWFKLGCGGEVMILPGAGLLVYLLLGVSS